MKLIDFAFRVFLAWGIGLFFYMIAMAMTVYDGFVSMILQPIMGTLFTIIAIVLLLIVGIPFLFKKIWLWWNKLKWISIILFFVCVLLMILSWFPFKITVIDYETKNTVEIFQPVLALIGWLGAIFSILYCPFISSQQIVNKVKKIIGLAPKHL
jgi:hypothetical protein